MYIMYSQVCKNAVGRCFLCVLLCFGYDSVLLGLCCVFVLLSRYGYVQSDLAAVDDMRIVYV